MHKPIFLKDIDLSFSHKLCFENFNAQISYGTRMAIIGKNGSGKSSLLKMIASFCAEDVVVGYVPQMIMDHTDLSGGQRLNKALTAALSLDPNVLLLDEPTNHLDSHNRKNLMKMLQKYSGTLIVVSHDKEVLRNCIDIIWHIENGNIQVFSGNYDDYVQELKLKRTSIESELERLGRQKRDMHKKLMSEQHRASKSKIKGEKSIDQKKWPTVVSKSKALKAQETSGAKKMAIDHRKVDLTNRLDAARLPEMIIPKFSIKSAGTTKDVLIRVSEGAIGYYVDQPLLKNINLSLSFGERMAFVGDNGSGKSTLVKALLKESGVYKTGEWYVPKISDIGYLDQHYSTLLPNKTVIETISSVAPNWNYAEIRRHLNDFLFRKNEEVEMQIQNLSGGEKARLVLAQIAAKTPKLLILDEMTNNLDLETKDHVVQVLKEYPGAIIAISHDADFLEEIKVCSYFRVMEGYVSGRD
jgi:ATPase subunit of ABC transporter with duplicated ATPase domains